MNNSIYIITDKFPYDKGEYFFETELSYLATAFNKIYIIPNKAGNGIQRKIPYENVIVLDPLHHSMMLSIFDMLISFGNIGFIMNELKNKSHGIKLRKLIDVFFVGFKTVSYANKIKKIINSAGLNDNCLLYFYWANIPANSAIVLSKSIKCVVRYHGSDLYEDFKNSAGGFSYRKSLLQSVTLNIFISEFGLKYVKSKYSEILFKAKVSRLGVDYFGKSQCSLDNTLRILTCSNVTHNKRLSLLIEALQMIPFSVIWNHIGDGPLMGEVLEMSKKLPYRVQVNFLGSKTNAEVRGFYLSNKVDLFVNVSLSEGVPVSIMEALSSGVPVIATDVGGTSEIVDSTVGFLIHKEVTPRLLCDTIIEFYKLTNREKEGYRINSFRKYTEMADARVQYSKFIEQLKEL